MPSMKSAEVKKILDKYFKKVKVVGEEFYLIFFTSTSSLLVKFGKFKIIKVSGSFWIQRDYYKGKVDAYQIYDKAPKTLEAFNEIYNI